MSMRKTVIAAAFAAVAVVGTAGTASADAGAVGGASDSPGILSGSVIQVPVDLDASICGNNVSLLSSLTSALGTTCTSA